MRVLFVSAEVAPFAKVGGLADVAASLPKSLTEKGHQVRVVMPGYAMALDCPAYNVRKIASALPISVNSHWHEFADVYEADFQGLTVTLIGNDYWFSGVHRSEDVYTPGIEQYLWFSQAVLQVSEQLGWKFDVVHTNDWHTGLIPVLMREKRQGYWGDTGTIFTIHNLAYQGEFDFGILDTLELPHDLWNPNSLETYGRLNFLKAGAAYSDQVTTVSPTYAEEIQHPPFGCRLEGLMSYLDSQRRLDGILNGIDETVFDPATDPFIPAKFTADDLSGKALCKKALLKELGLKPKAKAPLLGMVSRLSTQKGMDLVVRTAAEFLQWPCQLVVLGNGDPEIAAGFAGLQTDYPDRVHFRDGFEVELAPRIYAGSDLFLMPSAFEPCGLGQMIAMRYGTVPVVRKTGGLADTVHEGQNGFVFDQLLDDEFVAALRRAWDSFNNPDEFRKVQHNGLAAKHGWNGSAHAYLQVYERARARRRAEAS